MIEAIAHSSPLMGVSQPCVGIFMMHTARLWVTPRCPPGFSMSARQTLAANLKALMAQNGTVKSTTALERATHAKGLKVGKSTIDRALKAETPINLDYVEVFAKVFGVEPWTLLQPSGPARAEATAMTDDEAALMKAFRDIPPDEQTELLENTERRAQHYRRQLDRLLEARGLKPISTP